MSEEKTAFRIDDDEEESDAPPSSAFSIEEADGDHTAHDDDDDPAVREWDRLEQSQREEEKLYLREQVVQEQLNPRRSCLHRFFISVRYLTALAALNMAVGQAVGLSTQQQRDDGSVVGYVMRVYVTGISVAVVLNELHCWQYVLGTGGLLGNWLSRGLFYTFVGVVGMEESDRSVGTTTDAAHRWSERYVATVSWGMIGAGLLYAVMGLLCLQRVYNNAQEDYKRRLEAALDRKRNPSAAGTDVV